MDTKLYQQCLKLQTAFLTELANVFPEYNKKIKKYIKSECIIQFGKYKNEIKNRDPILFRIMTVDNVIKNLNFDSIWDKCTEKTKESIWKYIESLYLFEKRLNENRSETNEFIETMLKHTDSIKDNNKIDIKEAIEKFTQGQDPKVQKLFRTVGSEIADTFGDFDSDNPMEMVQKLLDKNTFNSINENLEKKFDKSEFQDILPNIEHMFDALETGDIGKMAESLLSPDIKEEYEINPNMDITQLNTMFNSFMKMNPAVMNVLKKRNEKNN